MEFPHPDRHSHMPFAFRRGGKVEVVYSQCTPRLRPRNGKMVASRPTAWKLHWLKPDADVAIPIDTGLADIDDECSPTVSENEDGVQLSFIGTLRGLKTKTPSIAGPKPHRLYVMRGPDLDSLGPATVYNDDQCYCGFARPDLTIQATGATGNASIIGHHSSGLTTSFLSLARISFCFDKPLWILVTGFPAPRCPAETIVVDLQSGQVVGELRVKDKPCYKPSLLGGTALVPHISVAHWRVSSHGTFAIAPTQRVFSLR